MVKIKNEYLNYRFSPEKWASGIRKMDFSPEKWAFGIRKMDFSPEKWASGIRKMDFSPEKWASGIQEMDFSGEKRFLREITDIYSLAEDLFPHCWLAVVDEGEFIEVHCTIRTTCEIIAIFTSGYNNYKVKSFRFF